MSDRKGSHSGRTIRTKGPKPDWKVGRLLGSGTEGEVYEIANDSSMAIKIYKPGRSPDSKKRAKLLAMEGLITPAIHEKSKTPDLTWPQHIIQDTSTGTIVAFLMPKVPASGVVPIGQYFSPSVRKSALQRARIQNKDHVTTCWTVISNFTQTIESLHAYHVILGDINDRNILIAPETGAVTIIDCDSFQVRDHRKGTTYRCSVGRPEYTSPELLAQLTGQCTIRSCQEKQTAHKRGYGCIERTPNDDMFAIAVIIFRLLMDGAHPYDCIFTKSSPHQPTSIKERIELGYFPYGPNRPSFIRPRSNTAAVYDALPESVRQLFQRSFENPT